MAQTARRTNRIDNERNIRVLRALRRIIRAVEVHSRRLADRHGVTAPQVVCLLAIQEAGTLSTTGLAQQARLSPSTVVGIVDRLEARGLVRRERDQRDRRCVNLSLTDVGQRLVRRAPSPLQDRLAEALDRLAVEEQETIAVSLERVVDLMEASDIQAAPVLETGPLVPQTRARRQRPPTTP